MSRSRTILGFVAVALIFGLIVFFRIQSQNKPRPHDQEDKHQAPTSDHAAVGRTEKGHRAGPVRDSTARRRRLAGRP